MPSQEQTIARRAAARLTGLDPRLPDLVDRALFTGPAGGPPARFAIDPISLASLIVSIASLGWTIYHDRMKDKAAADALIRRIRVELVTLDPPPKAPPEQLDQVIEAVAQEIMAAGSNSPPAD